jgi:hypothetical protein
MTRRKAEITARMNERDPHLVELALPPGGFRARSDAMLAFYRERDIQIHRGQGRNDEGQLYSFSITSSAGAGSGDGTSRPRLSRF